MSPASLARILAVGLLLLPGAAQSQNLDPITLVVGPSFHLPAGPEYAASGDIDNDGLDDGVIASTREHFVSVLLSAGDGSFRTGITFPVGARLGDVTTLDYNGDGNLDIAAIDQRGGISIASGLGDGRFNPPIFLRGDRLGQGIQAGDLDNRNGPDIVTANGRSKNLSVFINRGGNLGFFQSVEYGVGGNVIGDDVRIADFNTDGWNDIAILNVRNREADEISILLNNTRAQFNTVTKFLVNERAVSMTAGDWNDDGITDLAALEQGENFVNQRQFTMTILLNRTRIENGRLVGTAIFDQLQRVPISCPGSFNGAPIVCTVQDIESGDFNGDGLDDLVITIDTRFERDIGLATPGLVQAFIGLGDGNFVFSTRVNVGLRPRGMATGDTDGDLFDDIIVTEFRSLGFDPAQQNQDDNNARIVRAIAPPPRPIGVPCREPKQCENGNCVDGVCCRDALCPPGQRCDVPGFEGMCHPLGDLGDRCTIGSQCSSGFCVGGFCCASPQCPVGQFCNTGVCAGPAPPGNNCTANEQCNPPFCVNGMCCNQPACPVGQRCDIPPFEGMCRPLLGLGQPCTDDGQCASGFCTDNVCCVSDNCGEAQRCNVPGREGICSFIPTPTPTPTRTPTPQGNGRPCADPGECVSGNCVNNTCCASPVCPFPQRCDVSGSPGVCATPVPSDGGCNKDSDCASGNCDFTRPNPPFLGSCGPPHTPTPVPPGGSCQSTSQCVPGFACNVEEGRICCERLECPNGTSCRLPGKEGFCNALPTPTPTRLPNGARCPNGVVCQSGNCVNDTCCESPVCPEGTRCDILGFEGRCVPPLPEGSLCLTQSDCAPGLFCIPDNEGVRRCTRVAPTPTLIPTRTPSPSPQPTIIVDRDDGGCAIGDRRPEGSSAWLLAFFPLVLGLRRLQLAGASQQVTKPRMG